MKFARFCKLAFFVVLAAVGSAYGQPCQPPNPCGQLGVTAGTEFKANTSSLDAAGITINDNRVIPLAEESGVLIAEHGGGAAANSPRMVATALGGVVAKIGDFSLEGKATVLGQGIFREHGTIVNGAPSVGIIGGSGSAETFLSASVTDFVSVETISAPVGKRLLVLSRLKITGGFTASTTTHKFERFPGPPNIPTPPATAGSIRAFAGMTASKGAFFYDPLNVEFVGPVVDVGSISREPDIQGNVVEVNLPPPREIYWAFIAPNKQADAMGYGFHLTMRAMADAANTATVAGDFHGSIHWGGIMRVEDADTGQVITDWTVTSLSGFDYSKPFTPEVPEPASLASILIALFAPLTARRRGRSAI